MGLSSDYLLFFALFHRRRASKPLNCEASAPPSSDCPKPAKLPTPASIADSVGVSPRKKEAPVASIDKTSFGAASSSDQFYIARKDTVPKKRPASSISSILPCTSSSRVTSAVSSGTESSFFVANKSAKHYEEDVRVIFSFPSLTRLVALFWIYDCSAYRIILGAFSAFMLRTRTVPVGFMTSRSLSEFKSQPFVDFSCEHKGCVQS